MSSPNILTLGLAPALTVEETLQFGPLTIAPICESEDKSLIGVAEQYARQRGAHPSRQALVTCGSEVAPLVPTLWSLFVFSCVTYARRYLHGHVGVAFPENFHLLSVTNTRHGLVYESGHSLGMGGIEHLPLRWPVDWPSVLKDKCWDQRIELACRMLSQDPQAAAQNALVLASGMSADLACAALERRSQRVENVATSARSYVLLASAFEALHCKGDDARHKQTDVILGVHRLNPRSEVLGDQAFSDQAIGRPPVAAAGSSVTRPMLAVAQLMHLRNTYAHGRLPEKSSHLLPPEMNNCSVMRAGLLILAALMGDDLSGKTGCRVPEAPLERIRLEHHLRLNVGHMASIQRDETQLLKSIEEAIVPCKD